LIDMVKCPDCGAKLKHICRGEEWCCENPKCPANDGHGYVVAHAEYYGTTQSEINKQKRTK